MASALRPAEHIASKELTANLARDVVTSLHARCNVPYTRQPYDHDFASAVCAEGTRLGYSMEGPLSVAGPFIRSGVIIATTAYAHLPDKRGQIFICLYTAFVMYAEDVYSTDVGGVAEFSERLARGQPQNDRVLDNLVDLLRRAHEYFDRIIANIIMSCAINYITAILLEHDTNGMMLEPRAQRYPKFSRRMSGSPETYAVSIFPPALPLQSYIQAMPDLEVFINCTNDLMSFYKEELVGEQVNQVSLIAKCRCITKREALRVLEDQVVAAHDNIVEILAPHEDAACAFKRFVRGYIAFHTSLKRYKLDELDL
ncbi:hypothetical protein PLICRDRAFT_120583 [Plicaturopsis crispa FD-325 SS-3]|nr:hypothetical protein PLICRDRAFT_120583 [Plicaturopsis crispa FD-325 SS-3]